MLGRHGAGLQFFNGTSNSYASAAGLSTDFQLREINRNFLPTHTKAQFALFMVVRLPQAQDVGRIVMAHGDGTKMRAILMNMGPAGGAHVVLAGNLSLYETNQTSGSNSPLASTVLPGGYDNSGLCLITYVFDGGTKIMWDPENSDEVAAAKKTFDELVGKKKMLAFKVSKKGKQGEQIREFDPTAERLIITPALVGG
jgi:hypothetical protein